MGLLMYNKPMMRKDIPKIIMPHCPIVGIPAGSGSLGSAMGAHVAVGLTSGTQAIDSMEKSMPDKLGKIILKAVRLLKSNDGPVA